MLRLGLFGTLLLWLLSPTLTVGAEYDSESLNLIQVDQLSQMGSNNNTMKICIISAGYGLGHPDLPTVDSGVVTGYTPSKYDADSHPWDYDEDKHGTLVAGIIGAINGNGIGFTSVLGDNYDASGKYSFHICKGLRNSGSGHVDALVECVENCYYENDANIIHFALGQNNVGVSRSYDSVELETVIRQVTNQGVLVVSNSGDNTYPGAYSDVLAVSSVGTIDSTTDITTSSTYSAQVEISAPGYNIFSTTTYNGQVGHIWEGKTGTTMASAYVAGVAALVW